MMRGLIVLVSDKERKLHQRAGGYQFPLSLFRAQHLTRERFGEIVRSGSKREVTARHHDVRFTPETALGSRVYEYTA
jgi:hypothetical protein